MEDLGSLGGQFSQGSAINDRGQVTGYSDNSDDTEQHAFLYTDTSDPEKMSDLGTLGGADSAGFATNSAGQVAGYSFLADIHTQHAFLYTGTPGIDGQMIDLNAWLDAVDPIAGAKWTLNYGTGLSDAGLIVGAGEFDTGDGIESRAFVLDASALVPEPSSLSLLFAVAVAFRRRRNHR